MQYTEKLEPHEANFKARMLAAAKRNPEKKEWVRIVQIYIVREDESTYSSRYVSGIIRSSDVRNQPFAPTGH